MSSPAKHSSHNITLFEASVFTFHYLCNSTCSHNVPYRHRYGIRLSVIHPSSHVWIKGLVNNATKHFAITDRWQVNSYNSKITMFRISNWPSCQFYLGTLYCHKKLHETENPLISSNSFSAPFKGQKPKHHHEVGFWRHN